VSDVTFYAFNIRCQWRIDYEEWIKALPGWQHQSQGFDEDFRFILSGLLSNC